MRKYFNIAGQCNPELHYMVNIEKRLEEIKQLVDKGSYFVINRARQYGKTTILKALTSYLRTDYEAIYMSFQKMSSEQFRDEATFSAAFAGIFLKKGKAVEGLQESAVQNLQRAADEKENTLNLGSLFDCLNEICRTAKKPLVLIIDEVDSASNNQVFLDFLSQLRECYIERFETSTFQSVILAGVYDIKNLKLKFRPEIEHKYNSPWNIAARFAVDMSFSADDIEGMLKEYEQDNQTGMDLQSIATEIFAYTSGYPFLVSYICQVIDEELTNDPLFAKTNAWSDKGVREAVKRILRQPATLFDSMCRQIAEYSELREMLYAILFQGKSFSYNPDNYAIQIGTMFGFVTDHDGTAAIANRIFEMRLYNLFLSEEELGNVLHQAALKDKNQFVQDGKLNMERILSKFVDHFTEIYAGNSQTFIEENGRRLFLLYLKPIINGVGNYYIEARTRDMGRTDVIVDYLGRQYVIEMKIWHGEKYNKKGEEQLVRYLENYSLEIGYLLSFSFSKNKETGIKERIFNGKKIIEAIV